MKSVYCSPLVPRKGCTPQPTESTTQSESNAYSCTDHRKDHFVRTGQETRSSSRVPRYCTESNVGKRITSIRTRLFHTGLCVCGKCSPIWSQFCCAPRMAGVGSGAIKTQKCLPVRCSERRHTYWNTTHIGSFSNTRATERIKRKSIAELSSFFLFFFPSSPTNTYFVGEWVCVYVCVCLCYLKYTYSKPRNSDY